MARSAALSCLTATLTLGVAACNGCRSAPHADATQPNAAGGETPTLRLYAVSNLAGALEPCGCTKDQLGGIDHAAALVAHDRKGARGSLVVAAGPTMFLDPRLDPARATQDRWKAEAISASLGDIGLGAFTPGFNDWAGGPELFATLAKNTQAPVLFANLESAEVISTAIREIGGTKVGLAGVSAPLFEGARPSGIETNDPAKAMQSAALELRRQGANLLVGIAALPRGDALRLAELVPDLSVLIVGKPTESGDANDAPPPPVVVGGVLVVGSSNHLQTVAVVDFFVRDNDYKFHDATGIANAEAIISITKRMRELENRLAAWEKDPAVRSDDVAARRRDLAQLKEEKERLSQPPVPKAGSFFRYSLVEVRERLGSDPKVNDRMKAYYRRVDDHNRVAFAGRKPPPLPRGQSGYAGVEVCSTCHEDARQVWDRTAHARAYATLATQFKAYNLECVSCHVTGYERPGGSTVTMNESLRDVQCEECHGPGKAHAKAPKQAGLIVRDPKLDSCVSSCHHPPHVEGFDPARAKPLILGPGHGMPDDAPWPAWARDASAP